MLSVNRVSRDSKQLLEERGSSMGEINHDSRSRNRQLRLARNHPMETLRFFCDPSAILLRLMLSARFKN
jgi:hypothetical protein